MQIKATCPYCGSVDLGPEAVRLVTFAQRPSLNYYTFTCVDCFNFVQKPADFGVVIALQDYVQHEKREIPPEALEEHHGHPITQDEVLDFVNDVLRWL